MTQELTPRERRPYVDRPLKSITFVPRKNGAKQCKAMSKRPDPETGEKRQCLREARKDMDVCYWHGGSTPSAIKARERRQQRATLEKAIQTFGLPVEIDPETALLDEVRRSAGVVAWLDAEIKKLSAADIEQVDDKGTARPAVLIQLFGEERDHLARTAKMAIDAGIAERKVQLAEGQAHQMASVLGTFLTRMGLANDPDARAALAGALREMSALTQGRVIQGELAG